MRMLRTMEELCESSILASVDNLPVDIEEAMSADTTHAVDEPTSAWFLRQFKPRPTSPVESQPRNVLQTFSEHVQRELFLSGPKSQEVHPVKQIDIVETSREANSIQGVVSDLEDNVTVVTVAGSDPTKDQDYNFGYEVDETGTRVCRPHMTEILEEKICTTKPGVERRSAVIETLQDMHVTVYVVQGNYVIDGNMRRRSTKEILDHIRLVVGIVARENRIHDKKGPLGYRRCLLYEDLDGRLFNLTLAKHSVGPASRWEECLDSFSGKEAMIALTVLCRSFPCATEGMCR
jgi:hypothetical protein